MFEYLGLAYRYSDYTTVIAFVSPWLPMLERSLRLPVAVPFLEQAHEDSDHTAVTAVIHWWLHAETHAKLWVL